MNSQEEKPKEGKETVSIPQNLIETMKEGIFEVDLLGNFIFSNPSYAHMFGYTTNELIGTSYKDHMTEEEAKATFKAFNTVFKTEKARKSFKYQFIDKKGHKLYVEASIYLRYDSKGDKIGFLGFTRDITARVITERRLKKSEHEYRTIIENIEEGYFEIDRKGNFTYFNPACSDILGYKPQEMIGMNYREYMTEREAKKIFEVYNKIYNEDSVNLKTQYTLITKAGDKIYCESSIYLRRDKNGEKIGFRGFVRDITARVKAEERLKKSEEKYRNIIENTKEGYFEVDLAGSFTYFNQALSNMLGYTQEELMDMNYADIMTEQKAKEAYRIFNKVFRTEKTHVSFEYELISKNNKKLYGESSVYLRYDDRGNKVGFSGFVRDVTKLREAYNRAEFYREILSHDIRNILNSIKLSFEYIQEAEKSLQKDEELREMAQIIEKQIERASSLILNIQKLASIENQVLPIKKVNLTEIVNEAISGIRNRSLSKNIFIEFKPFKKRNMVLGGDLLTEAFENILLNGITHNTSEKKILLIKCSLVLLGTRPHTKIEFIDNGIGIPNDQKKKIFSRNYKNEKARGMGIGLSLVRKIIGIYNGQIRVKNRVEGDYTKGSNFIVLLKNAQ